MEILCRAEIFEYALVDNIFIDNDEIIFIFSFIVRLSMAMQHRIIPYEQTFRLHE